MFNRMKSEIYVFRIVTLTDEFESALNLCDSCSYMMYLCHSNSESTFGAESC
jgi:hypothetical protein